MKLLKLYCLYACLFLITSARAQVTNCPDNINFEQGSLTNWECATSTNTGNGNYVWMPTAVIPTRHAIMSGAALDPYGHFPVVAPGGGQYSLKLGNSSTGREMERVRYTLHVPANATNYNLIYRYAVVLNDGGHQPIDQPFFRLSVTDSATGQPLPCNNSIFVSTSNLPGFQQSNVSPSVYYKDWSAATLRIANMAGSTILIEFASSDCSMGGHFGYGYVDLNCEGYIITSANCNNAPITPLIGPPGYQSYEWYDNSYQILAGTGQTITVPSPAPSNFYHVVLTPYPGYGCVDTLTTEIRYSTLSVDASPDTSYLCDRSQQAMLHVTQTGSAPPFTYSWTPVASLSCVTCTNPIATPTVNTVYTVAVTDSFGCTITDDAVVNAGVTITLFQHNVTCNGAANGTVSSAVAGGRPPYAYNWSTSPAQTTATATGLAPGTYYLNVTDANGCSATNMVIITQPPPLSVSSTSINVTCNGGHDGSAAVSVSGGTPRYTYSWNTTPAVTANSITNLVASTYTCTITDTNGCTITATKVITQPLPLLSHTTIVKAPCAGLSEGTLAVTATGGSGPYSYAWVSGTLQGGDTVRNLQAGQYIVQVTDSKGCHTNDTVLLNANPLPTVSAGADVDICVGDSALLTANGAASYLWQPAAFLTCTACAQPTAYPDSTKSYYVTGTDRNGCVDIDTVNIAVLRRVPVNIDTTRYICPKERIALGAYGGESYEWSPPGTLLNANLPNPVASPDSTTIYQVIITENRCFKDTLTQKVVVMPKPDIHLGADFYGIPGATVALGTQVTGASSIAWTPADGLSCSDCYEPVATLDNSITYVAEVGNSYGCKASDSISIKVACDGSAIYMANTFTPNSDGQNDYFYPQGLGINNVQRFMIYDRWGETVFTATDIPANVPERGWDGTFRGKALPPDVFLFVVETLCRNGSPIVVKGDITLVR